MEADAKLLVLEYPLVPAAGVDDELSDCCTSHCISLVCSWQRLASQRASTSRLTSIRDSTRSMAASYCSSVKPSLFASSRPEKETDSPEAGVLDASILLFLWRQYWLKWAGHIIELGKISNSRCGRPVRFEGCERTGFKRERGRD